MTMNDPLPARTAMQKSSCITPMKPSPVCRATPSACAIKCARTKLREAVEQALLRFPHMMLTAELTETSVPLPPKRAARRSAAVRRCIHRYTIGSKGYERILYFSSATTTRPSIWSISTLSRMDAGSEEFIRCVIVPVPENCGFPVENDGSVRGMDTRWSPEESANGYEQLADREFSPDGI